ncbi:hypothetical protein Btru_030227 [Bulinus truncatus]|nr:hypothetical protein Btru_030227 [Bulinus truncatus]
MSDPHPTPQEEDTSVTWITAVTKVPSLPAGVANVWHKKALFRSFDAAFIKAAEFLGHKRMLQKFIEKGVSINRKDSHGDTALHIASMHGYIDLLVVQVGWYQLLPNVDVHASKGVLNKILALACKDHNYELAKFVLECGAEVNQKNGFKTSFFSALGSIDLVKLFLNFGADVNTTSCIVKILYEAVHLDDSIIIETLIKHGADIDASCALGLYCFNGADPNIRNKEETALNLAAKYCTTPVLDLLIKRGADINAQDHNGGTSLMVAAGVGNHKKVKHLINCKADVNIRTYNGSSAAILAVNGAIATAEAALPAAKAMFSKNTNLVLCFLKHWYLDKSDVKLLQSTSLHHLIFRENLPHSFHSINEPFSLKCLSFWWCQQQLAATLTGRPDCRFTHTICDENALLFQTRKQCLPDGKVKEYTQRTLFPNYTQQGLVGLDAVTKIFLEIYSHKVSLEIYAVDSSVP